MTTLYVDTSALLKRVIVEAESSAVRVFLRDRDAAGDLLTSSSLAWLEVWRSLRRAAVADIEQLAAGAMSGVAEFPLSESVLARARRVGTDELRSLDAVHLASAIAVGADHVLTYDDRLAVAVAYAGLGVVAPTDESVRSTGQQSDSPTVGRTSDAGSTVDAMTSTDLFATDRQDPALSGAERPMLDGWLDYHRDTLLRKCDGLTAEQLRLRSCEPSTLTLHGLVRHMAEVESWFNNDLIDDEVPPIFYSERRPDGDFDDLDDASLEDDVATYRRSVQRSRDFAARTPDLDTVCGSRNGADITLRWIYLHMIEEYARHNGHADLLRERIDGAVGD